MVLMKLLILQLSKRKLLHMLLFTTWLSTNGSVHSMTTGKLPNTTKLVLMLLHMDTAFYKSLKLIFLKSLINKLFNNSSTVSSKKTNSLIQLQLSHALMILPPIRLLFLSDKFLIKLPKVQLATYLLWKTLFKNSETKFQIQLKIVWKVIKNLLTLDTNMELTTPLIPQLLKRKSLLTSLFTTWLFTNGSDHSMITGKLENHIKLDLMLHHMVTTSWVWVKKALKFQLSNSNKQRTNSSKRTLKHLEISDCENDLNKWLSYEFCFF